ncbi:MAG: tetratricopeptide repeat protein [Patescibacteria group bacterium]
MYQSNQKFNIFLSLAVVLVLLGTGIVAYDYWQSKNSQPANTVNNVVLSDIDNNLTAQEKGIYETRLAEGQKMWNEFNEDQGTSLDKFKIKMYIGAQYFGLGKLDLAKQFYLEAAELKNDEIGPYTSLYTVYITAKEHNLAKQAIKQGLDIDPGNFDAWLKYITLEQEKLNAGKDFVKSLYIEALQKTSSRSEVLVAYARFLENSGELGLAITEWQEVLKQEPDNELYKQELARLIEKNK